LREKLPGAMFKRAQSRQMFATINATFTKELTVEAVERLSSLSW
jgi:hypothetical protein